MAGNSYMGQNKETQEIKVREKNGNNSDFVLEKIIFSDIFEKDIRRVFIYKKAERLAKAIHLISPAFTSSQTLKGRFDALALAIIDAAAGAPSVSRPALSRELLALSSALALARTSGLLSAMNAHILTEEAGGLLQEVAEYEEPRLTLDEAPSLAQIAKRSSVTNRLSVGKQQTPAERVPVRDIERTSNRRDSILSVIQNKGQVKIKDVSVVIRGVSEKTIQRELQTLVGEGILKKEGERRWSTYSLV